MAHDSSSHWHQNAHIVSIKLPRRRLPRPHVFDNLDALLYMLLTQGKAQEGLVIKPILAEPLIRTDVSLL